MWSQFHLIWTPLNRIFLFNKAKREDNDSIIQHFISCIFWLFSITRSVFSSGLANLLYIEEINAKKRKVIKIMFQEIYTISSYIWIVWSLTIFSMLRSCLIDLVLSKMKSWTTSKGCSMDLIGLRGSSKSLPTLEVATCLTLACA